MDEERIQTHGIAAGGVVYHLIPGLHGWTVLDFKKTVILHTGEAGDPLAFYYGPFFRLIHINHMVGINMSGDKRVQVCTAAVSDEEGMVTDFLHIFYRGDECRSLEIRDTPGSAISVVRVGSNFLRSSLQMA